MHMKSAWVCLPMKRLQYTGVCTHPHTCYMFDSEGWWLCVCVFPCNYVILVARNVYDCSMCVHPDPRGEWQLTLTPRGWAGCHGHSRDVWRFRQVPQKNIDLSCFASFFVAMTFSYMWIHIWCQSSTHTLTDKKNKTKQKNPTTCKQTMTKQTCKVTILVVNRGHQGAALPKMAVEDLHNWTLFGNLIYIRLHKQMMTIFCLLYISQPLKTISVLRYSAFMHTSTTKRKKINHL